MLSHQIIADLYPQASAVAKIAQHLLAQGKTTPPEQAQPVYLRNNIARRENERS